MRFLRWAQNPFIKQVNMAFCLIADRLAEVNERLVQSPHVATIEVPLPDRDERCRFAPVGDAGAGLREAGRFLARAVGRHVQRAEPGQSERRAVAGHAHRDHRVDAGTFRQLKKIGDRAAVPRAGRVRRARPHARLVAGQAEAKKRLQEDAQWISRGQLDAAPMGYLICGPVGTGKTFLAECYAGSIGIPCVVLKNFRSKYVGETEGNLQQVLAVLRSLGPVVVIIDEADAALGNRQADGDSGTSARVFSMIAAQMGNTRYRGQIIWMLLTSRPDLLPIDLKRQGRAEVHIPLFYPYEEAEIRAMFAGHGEEEQAEAGRRRHARRSRPTDVLSGADIESIVLTAKRAALAAGRTELTAGRSGAAVEGVHSLGAGLGEGAARDGRRAGMHANEPVAAAVAGKGIEAGRPHATARADGGHPADVGERRTS